MSISCQSRPSARPNHRGITIILQNVDLSLFLEVKSWQLSIFSVRPIKSAISRHIMWSRPMLPALLATKYIQRISHRNIVRQVFEGENPCDTWRATTLNKLRKKKRRWLSVGVLLNGFRRMKNSVGGRAVAREDQQQFGHRIRMPLKTSRKTRSSLYR